MKKDTPTMDTNFLTDLLNRLTLALRQSDVSSALILQFQTMVHELITPTHATDRRAICETVSNELCNLLQGHEIPETTVACPNRGGPKEGETLVVMFAGFQGTGKTTTCAKFASYYANRGWLPVLVCADMYTPGALDKLKAEAAKNNNAAVFGSHAPGRFAKEAIDECKRDGYNLMIVDTSGLLEDMRKVYEAIRPDVVMLVIDGSVGQVACDHVRTFQQNFDVGGVITTKMNSCNAIGTLSAIASTKSRVAFTCTSPLSDVEEFDVKVTASRLLIGMSDDLSVVVEGGDDHSLRSMYRQVKNKVKKCRAWLKKKKKKVTTFVDRQLDKISEIALDMAMIADIFDDDI